MSPNFLFLMNHLVVLTLLTPDLIKDEILALKDKGTSIIFSTHRMESVEELCEYIALIHESEKLLDGKLSDIKKAYKNNIFKIGLQTEENKESILKSLDSDFQITESTYHIAEKQFDFTVQLPSDDTSAILGKLGTLGNINHFNETIPSASDIFIQTVKSKTV